MLKMGGFRKLMLVFLLGLIEMVVSALEPGRVMRLSVQTAGLSEGTFVVFEQLESDGTAICHRLRADDLHRIPSSHLSVLPFGERITVFEVSGYLLASCFDNHKTAPVYAAFGEALGGSQRFKYYRGFVDRCDSLMADLSSLLDQRGEEMRIHKRDDEPKRKLEVSLNRRSSVNAISDYDDKIVDAVTMWEGNRLLADVLRSGDVLAAVSLYELFAHRLRGLIVTRLAAGDKLGQKLQRMLGEDETSLVSVATKILAVNEPRVANYRKLFPQTQGIWSDPLPSSYSGLKKMVERGHQACSEIDQLSEWTQFEDWGKVALEVLYLVRDHNTAREFEAHFDAAFQKYQTVVLRKPSSKTGIGSGVYSKETKP